ncbi:aerotolerance regulator BatC [Flavobacteriales bacterium 33_180_T64]|nr:aerotolerance regulator BatC [Flavobacteriales bacterium 33_180_T64]
MKKLVIICAVLLTTLSFAQDKEARERAQQLTLEKANSYVYDGNELIEADNYISAEKEYRKAISKAPSIVAGTYNLGNTHYEKGNYDEALYRHTQAVEKAITKTEKHKAYHNIGNILMKEAQCKEAVEAYKSALRNDPTDDETRYNLVVAKECAAQQQEKKDKEEENKDEDKDDENKDKDQKEDDQKKEDPKDEGDQDKKDGDDQKDDEGKPKDEKDQDKGDKQDDKKQKGKPKPQPGQLSPQQIKNLLEAMNNQEQKVLDKINAQKQKGVKVKPEKDW